MQKAGNTHPKWTVTKLHKLWHTRGYLPHFDASDTLQFLTYRLNDSLPKSCIEKYLKLKAADKDKTYKYVESIIDNGYGSCLLQDKDVAEQVLSTWLHDNQTKYLIHDWVIMPNHVHILIQQYPGYSLSAIIQTWKSVSTRKINKLKGLTGSLWGNDYWDRYIRNEKHYLRVAHYIRENPVKCGLVSNARDWDFSSAC